ncbi:hypothetical protein [Dielma fastidiosa]|uniref:Uncharacterized protein n=1 Tax=Dielma fastidiosa TaxID=1034346 RepID=A0AB35UR86_9FIRM|nr:hypothetical protein [Dielma fastidiosa]MDY5168589.1 hypothetical protein [Dielma fastidiosa]
MDLTENEIKQNKYIRGRILRCLVNGNNYCLYARQIINPLLDDATIMTPDISKYITYLHDAGYIEFVDKKVNAYTAYGNDALIKMTRKGVDLVEGTIEDPGVDI